MGLQWIKEIREGEASTSSARNPHELVRTVECFSRLDVAELIIHSSLARKASSKLLDFTRMDYKDIDPNEWNKFVTIKRVDEDIQVVEKPFKYWLLPPNAPSYEENYKLHSCK